MKKVVKILSVLMSSCMLLNIGLPVAEAAPSSTLEMAEEIFVNNELEQPIAWSDSDDASEENPFNEGVILVKYDGEMNDAVLAQFEFVSAAPLYNGSSWYLVTLKEGADTAETVNHLRELEFFDAVDYDYIMNTTVEGEAEISDNPNYVNQKNHGVHKIPQGWDEFKKNGKHPGGYSDVVIAVIDTGVDYNHLDLRNNIWMNPAEIPDNGIDDDKNGYIDDVYGWDCVGNNKDPMDDNGHGTHVAGIIAAENNKIGGVGVAYNCKIMVLKAGSSSGYFNNSDIAEAVQYAYMNGASVINMSFGGSSISMPVEEALENAYNTCVLVAAAGNEGLCNNLACQTCDMKGVSYPAALPYVIGVMSVNTEGTVVSSFSNYDHKPYDTVEYEVYAVGEALPSTWPGNKYATLNGTSMAAPTVSGIAALLRSYYADPEVHSTKFIQSQIVNTGTINPYNFLTEKVDEAHSVTNVYEALTQLPKPEVNLYDYYIDDSTAINATNNGNGVIDAGETVGLHISLHNRGGVATNVNVSIDTMRNGDPSLTDEYFTFVNPTMQLSDIGTYSVRESGEQYFMIMVDDKCPNDYPVDFNIRFTYENGIDEDDNTVYTDDGKQKAQFNVSRGYHLPSIISEDTTFKADRLYIVGENVVIPEGITVTFEEGCEIQFYDDREYYNSPIMEVYGTLNMLGSEKNCITVRPSERYWDFRCGIKVNEGGRIYAKFIDSINLFINDSYSKATSQVDNSKLKISGVMSSGHHICVFQNGSKQAHSQLDHSIDECTNSYIDLTLFNSRGMIFESMTGNYICVMYKSAASFICSNQFDNNILFSMAKGSSDVEISGLNGSVRNNFFLSSSNKDATTIFPLDIKSPSNVINNSFSLIYQKFASQIFNNYYDSTGNPTIDVYGSCSDISVLWPYVVSVEMFDASGNAITTVGREEIKVRVTFNRPMDTTQDTFLTFGTIEPYADYRIDGQWISSTVWEGSYTLKAQIENGQNFLKVNNACAAEDSTKVVFGENHLHEFTIDTTEAMAMNLQAFATENGILLNFVQDDYDTLLGYNIYRADSKDGNYVKMNSTVVLPTENIFLDENAEPGKTYWYTYTVVLSDFTESNPAGKVMATAMDTQAPNMYHTPVNQGYLDNNLVISCTASDNVAISAVTLYYRTVGATEWQTRTMSKQSDKYSATIFGRELTLDGLEYYIVASDGRNTINKGSAEIPYTVTIKDASAISRLGDVDGDGVVTTRDALMIMQTINGDRILSDDEFKRADLNVDTQLNTSEALRILQYINGKVTGLSMQ